MKNIIRMIKERAHPNNIFLQACTAKGDRLITKREIELIKAFTYQDEETRSNSTVI